MRLPAKTAEIPGGAALDGASQVSASTSFVIVEKHNIGEAALVLRKVMAKDCNDKEIELTNSFHSKK